MLNWCKEILMCTCCLYPCHQAITWTIAEILLIRLLGTNFSELLIRINSFLFKKMHLKMSSGKCCPFCPSLNVLNAFIKIWPKRLGGSCHSVPRWSWVHQPHYFECWGYDSHGVARHSLMFHPLWNVSPLETIHQLNLTRRHICCSFLSCVHRENANFSVILFPK